MRQFRHPRFCPSNPIHYDALIRLLKLASSFFHSRSVPRAAQHLRGSALHPRINLPSSGGNVATLTIAPPAQSSPQERIRNHPAQDHLHRFSDRTPCRKVCRRRPQSVCPECLQVIDARLFEEDGAVYMEKTCVAHGEFRDKIYSDARLYLKMEEWEFGDNRGLGEPCLSRMPRAVRTTAVSAHCTPRTRFFPTWI